MALRVGSKVLIQGRVATISSVLIEYEVVYDDIPNTHSYGYDEESTGPYPTYSRVIPIPENATPEQIKALQSIVTERAT